MSSPWTRSVRSRTMLAASLSLRALPRKRDRSPMLSTTTPALPVNLSHVPTFVGALLGAMLVYLFSSLAIRAVGSAGSEIIEDVRRQFREDPGIMQGTSKPDYGRAVDITAKSALRHMVAP